MPPRPAAPARAPPISAPITPTATVRRHPSLPRPLTLPPMVPAMKPTTIQPSRFTAADLTYAARVVDDLSRTRATRWWHDRPQVKTPAKAVAFVSDVGFALLFPKKDVELPSLWEVARDDPPTPSDGWGPDIQR